jgi:hypothetical protein
MIKMIKNICNHCKKLNEDCVGIDDKSVYTGCAQKESYYTEYGEHVLSFFKQRCINIFGHEILNVLNVDFKMLNRCVVSDETLAGWLLWVYENKPQLMFKQLKAYSHGLDDYPISVVLLSDKNATNTVGTYITKTGIITNLLRKAVQEVVEWK